MSTARKGNRKSAIGVQFQTVRDMAPGRGLFSERSAMTRMCVITREESAPPGMNHAVLSAWSSRRPFLRTTAGCDDTGQQQTPVPATPFYRASR